MNAKACILSGMMLATVGFLAGSVHEAGLLTNVMEGVIGGDGACYCRGGLPYRFVLLASLMLICLRYFPPGGAEMMNTKVALLALVTAASIGAAHAADSCKAVAIRDVPAIESPTSIWRKGQTDVVTGFADNVYYHHGGYGYQASALRLLNCIRIGNYLILDTSKNSRKALSFDHIDDRLLEFGLCSACASEAATKYVGGASPKFKALVDRALDGDKRAIELLNGERP